VYKRQGVLTHLSRSQERFGIIAEQAEDEISAVNMAIGGWYAGARAMVTTSGGGFALMTEGVSLAGMIESPLVVHIAQRPGPATGLPTRTEQADLMMALFSGHGEFPRAIFAPGDAEEAHALSARAFMLADRHQVPVFILTDQFMVDSIYDIEMPSVPGMVERYVIRTREDYVRFAMTPNGISPRGVPGLGNGLVCVDSDEHDELGHITEDLGIRVAMNDKRLAKSKGLLDDVVEPTFHGGDGTGYLVIGWGSTKHAMIEAVRRLGRDDVSVLHLSQVYPVPRSVREALGKAKGHIFVENNATSQLMRLFKMEIDADPGATVVQYDGLPFASDVLGEMIRNEIAKLEGVL
jgi:2-oxoglutarate ferredoxin oxidoreductase subunit alpha